MPPDQNLDVLMFGRPPSFQTWDLTNHSTID